MYTRNRRRAKKLIPDKSKSCKSSQTSARFAAYSVGINQWNYLQPLFGSVMSRPDIPCYDFAEEIRQVIQMMPESRVNVASNKLGAAGRT